MQHLYAIITKSSLSRQKVSTSSLFFMGEFIQCGDTGEMKLYVTTSNGWMFFSRVKARSKSSISCCHRQIFYIFLAISLTKLFVITGEMFLLESWDNIIDRSCFLESCFWFHYIKKAGLTITQEGPTHQAKVWVPNTKMSFFLQTENTAGHRGIVP